MATQPLTNKVYFCITQEQMFTISALLSLVFSLYIMKIYNLLDALLVH